MRHATPTNFLDDSKNLKAKSYLKDFGISKRDLIQLDRFSIRQLYTSFRSNISKSTREETYL